MSASEASHYAVGHSSSRHTAMLNRLLALQIPALARRDWYMSNAYRKFVSGSAIATCQIRPVSCKIVTGTGPAAAFTQLLGEFRDDAADVKESQPVRERMPSRSMKVWIVSSITYFHVYSLRWDRGAQSRVPAFERWRKAEPAI